jgi:hypothetical protein
MQVRVLARRRFTRARPVGSGVADLGLRQKLHRSFVVMINGFALTSAAAALARARPTGLEIDTTLTRLFAAYFFR